MLFECYVGVVGFLMSPIYHSYFNIPNQNIEQHNRRQTHTIHQNRGSAQTALNPLAEK